MLVKILQNGARQILAEPFDHKHPGYIQHAPDSVLADLQSNVMLLGSLKQPADSNRNSAALLECSYDSLIDYMKVWLILAPWGSLQQVWNPIPSLRQAAC